MALTNQENLVLQAVLLQARHSSEQIARQLGVRNHTVRRIVSRLEERKVLLGTRAYVNPYPLGFQVYQVLFSVPHATADLHNKLISRLCALEGVGLVSELSGEPQYEMHVLARDSQDVTSLLDSLQVVAPLLQVFSLSVVHEQLYSGALGHLLRNSPDYKPLRYGATATKVEIDRLDYSLLSVLANESVNSWRILSQRLKVPQTTIAYRIASLEERGLIAGYYHLCDFKPLGLLPVVGLLRTSLLSPAVRERLIKYCNLHPQIAYVDLMTGAFSVRVFIRAGSYEEARQVAGELQEKFGENVHSIRIMPQLQFMRHSTFPFKARS